MSRRTVTTRALLTALACACLWVGCGESPTTDPSPIDPETILREELARQGLSPSWFPGCIWQTFRLRLPSYQGQSLEFILADIRAIIAACLRTNQVVSCPAAVNEDIAALFPTENNLRQDAVAECGRIYQDFEDDEEDAAAEKAVQFFGRTLEQNENGELLDPAPSAEQKIAEIFAGIFDDVGLDFPDIDPGALASGEYAVGTLVPNGPPLLTSSKHAGIDDGGGLFGPVQVIIVQIHAESGGLGTSSVSHPCPAGIDDRFDCYPLFFDYTVVPASNVNPAVGLKLGQCNISPPEIEVLLATPEGLLPEDDSPVGLDCTDVQPQAAMTGWRSFAWAAAGADRSALPCARGVRGQEPRRRQDLGVQPGRAGAAVGWWRRGGATAPRHRHRRVQRRQRVRRLRDVEPEQRPDGGEPGRLHDREGARRRRRGVVRLPHLAPRRRARLHRWLGAPQHDRSGGL